MRCRHGCREVVMFHVVVPVAVILRATPTPTTLDFHTRNGGIFTVGAAGVGDAPTVGVLGSQQPSRPYRWHCRGGW